MNRGTIIDLDVVGSTYAPEKPKKKMSVINIMDDMDCISSKVCCYIKYTCETFFSFFSDLFPFCNEYMCENQSFVL